MEPGRLIGPRFLKPEVDQRRRRPATSFNAVADPIASALQRAREFNGLGILTCDQDVVAPERGGDPAGAAGRGQEQRR
jgi:hypothetical protein